MAANIPTMGFDWETVPEFAEEDEDETEDPGEEELTELWELEDEALVVVEDDDTAVLDEELDVAVVFVDALDDEELEWVLLELLVLTTFKFMIAAIGVAGASFLPRFPKLKISSIVASVE